MRQRKRDGIVFNNYFLLFLQRFFNHGLFSSPPNLPHVAGRHAVAKQFAPGLKIINTVENYFEYSNERDRQKHPRDTPQRITQQHDYDRDQCIYTHFDGYKTREYNVVINKLDNQESNKDPQLGGIAVFGHRGYQHG